MEQSHCITPPQCDAELIVLIQLTLLARDAQAKLALIVAQCLSIHLSICVSVRDSLSHAYVRSIARREPRRLPACAQITEFTCMATSAYTHFFISLENAFSMHEMPRDLSAKLVAIYLY